MITNKNIDLQQWVPDNIMYRYEVGFGLIYNYYRAVETAHMDVITVMGYSADLLLT